jgi:glycosyltransferase involved in cell wall biosynthesis
MRKLLFSAWAVFFRVIPVRWARYLCQLNRNTNKARKDAARQMLVDVSVIYQSDARTGIQRVVRAVLLQLIQNPPKGFCVRPVYATRQFNYRYADVNFLARDPVELQEQAATIDVNPQDIFLGLDLAAHLLPHHQAQLLDWKTHGVELHVLVYDLLPLQTPHWFNPATHRNFERWVRWMAVYADHAICISATVQDQLKVILRGKFHLSVDALPVRAITLGADIQASQPSSGIPEVHKELIHKIRNTKAILVVGTLEPRKGHEQVLAAFELLWSKPNPPLLVFAGKPGWKTEALQASIRSHPQVDQNLHWIDNASDEMLQLLYQDSWGVLAASKAEGFGLPVIEAAVLNKPVLARDLPVFREIGLPNITYFHADSAHELALAVSDWMSLPHDELPTESQIKSYSWETATRQLTHPMELPHQTGLYSQRIATFLQQQPAS